MHLIVPAAVWCWLAAPVGGTTITWQGEGMVTSVMGFSDLGIEPGTASTFVFSYEDTAVETEIENFGFYARVDYWDGIQLDARVTVSGHTWQGSIGSGEDKNSPTTLEIEDYRPDLGPDTADVWRVTIPRSEGAEFPRFPGGEGDLMSFTFRDDEVPLDFIGSVKLFFPLLNLEGITGASGQVRSAAGDLLRFTIDPETIRVSSEVSLTSVDFVDGMVTLSWEADFDDRYTIYWSDSLEDETWVELTTVIGDDFVESVSFEPVGGSRAQFYRIVRQL